MNGPTFARLITIFSYDFAMFPFDFPPGAAVAMPSIMAAFVLDGAVVLTPRPVPMVLACCVV